MSGSVNKAIIIGNLGADPEVRTTQSGQMVATLSIATSETFNNRDGQRQERTEWHRVVVWGKTAELAERYLRKGRKVYIEGRIQTRSWDDPNGQKRYSTEIVANQMTFLDSTAGGPGAAPSGGAYGGGQGGGGGGGYGGGPGGGGYGGSQGGGGGYGGGAPAQSQPPRGGAAPSPSQGGGAPAGGDAEFFDDDIPF